jgi:hypothetical protein
MEDKDKIIDDISDRLRKAKKFYVITDDGEEMRRNSFGFSGIEIIGWLQQTITSISLQMMDDSRVTKTRIVEVGKKDKQ